MSRCKSSRFSPKVLPVTVITSRWSISFKYSCTKGTPPANQKDSVRCWPLGLIFPRWGTLWLISSKSSGSKWMPSSRAMEGRWMVALVEPPMALCTTMAFSKASRVRMSWGRMSFSMRERICRPACRAPA